MPSFTPSFPAWLVRIATLLRLYDRFERVKGRVRGRRDASAAESEPRDESLFLRPAAAL